MKSSSGNLHIYLLITLISCLTICESAPAPFLSALPSLETVQTAMERAANYGYEMLGYGHHEYDDVIIKDKPTLWDGHILVPDIVSPLLAAIPDLELDVYDKDKSKRIVKGHDGRLGFRVAVPYFGDVQYVREFGPGRFTDKLGPGEYLYPSLDYKLKKDKEKGKEKDYYGAPKTKDIYVPKPQKTIYPKKIYQGLQHWPWNVNK